MDLKGKDPDDAFSSVPYEKGFNFLFYLENLIGKDKFDKFIPHVCFPLTAILELKFKQSYRRIDTFSKSTLRNTKRRLSIRMNSSRASSVFSHPTLKPMPYSPPSIGINGSTALDSHQNRTLTPHWLTSFTLWRRNGERLPSQDFLRPQLMSTA